MCQDWKVKAVPRATLPSRINVYTRLFFFNLIFPPYMFLLGNTRSFILVFSELIMFSFYHVISFSFHSPTKKALQSNLNLTKMKLKREKQHLGAALLNVSKYTSIIHSWRNSSIHVYMALHFHSRGERTCEGPRLAAKKNLKSMDDLVWKCSCFRKSFIFVSNLNCKPQRVETVYECPLLGPSEFLLQKRTGS